MLYPENGGSHNLRNLDNYIPIGTVLNRRRLSNMHVILVFWYCGPAEFDGESAKKNLTLERVYVKFNSLNNFRCKSLPVLKVVESSLIILSVVEKLTRQKSHFALILRTLYK
jgi:hypothetical protein